MATRNASRPRKVLRESVDLLVLTVTETEWIAAKKVIENETGKMEPVDCHFKSTEKKRIFAVDYVEWGGFFSEERGPAKIVLASVSGMGSEETSGAVASISKTTLNPSVIAMVGMCAGDEHKVRLGDVLVPFKIAKASGKETKGKFNAEAEYSEISRELKNPISSEVTRKSFDWQQFIPKNMMSTPSPICLHDFILSKVGHSPGFALI